MVVLKNPALWASIAALFAALGIFVPDLLWDHLAAVIAGLTGIVGILTSFAEAGHKIVYEPPDAKH